MDNTADTSERRNSNHTIRRPSESDSQGRVRPSKRHKDDQVRTRVSRACDRCKSRKTRCSGKWPCVFCSQLKLECQFTASYRRGQAPAVEIDADQDVHLTHGAAGRSYGPGFQTGPTGVQPASSSDGGTTVPDGPPWPGFDSRPPSHLLNSGLPGSHDHQETRRELLGAPPQQPEAGASATQSMRNSPERNQTDQQGHYVGPASGVSFLLRIQRKLHEQSSGSASSSIFTFGDLPLPGFDSSFAILPPKPQAEAMVQRYFDFGSATHRFLHRPTVEVWLGELYETNGAMRGRETANSRIALLFMIFAHSTSYSSRGSSDTNVLTAEAVESGARFFSVAEHQLSSEKGEIRLTSVQARLAQCFYLLSQSRLNHCWALFGITAHLVLALGIHRRSRVDPKRPNVDYIELECRKRTFWCAYNLNTYLSAALGRPMTFHDEDIDQEFPLCVDDSQLLGRQTTSLPASGQSILSAPVAQHRLSRIVSRVLREIYGIRPPSTEEHFKLASKFTAQLDQWRKDISYLLESDADPAIFVKLVLRQREVLKLAFWHARVLVQRPFLLHSFTSLADYSANSRLLASRRDELQQNIRHCLDAANQIVQLIDQIDAAGEFYSTLFFIPYYGFSAVVVLYVYAIQKRSAPPESYLGYFQSASKCHAQIESIASRGSLMQRYGVVLQELRLEVMKHNTYLAAAVTPTTGEVLASPSSLHPNGLAQVQWRPSLERPQQSHGDSISGPSGTVDADSRGMGITGGTSTGIGSIFTDEGQDLSQIFGTDSLMFSGESLDSDIAHMAGWGHFDSLVTGGTDRLDGFFPVSATEGWGVGSGAV